MWDLEAALHNAAVLDSPGEQVPTSNLDGEIAGACFVGDDVVLSTGEEWDPEEPGSFRSNSLARWSQEETRFVWPVAFDASPGDLLPMGGVLSVNGHPRWHDPGSGAVRLEWPELETGSSDSSITWDQTFTGPARLALDERGHRFAHTPTAGRSPSSTGMRERSDWRETVALRSRGGTRMDEAMLVATRRSLHGVAELVIAGPQFRTQESIELRVRPGGFGGRRSSVGVDGHDLVWDGGRLRLEGTCRELAGATGQQISDLADVYAGGSGVDPDEPLALDSEALGQLLAWFGRGDAALRTFASDVEPVLWPEHFDVGITVGEVNYGASPGDSTHTGPYAYVGPWTRREGEFWNAPFGALRDASELPDVDALVTFFEAGRDASDER